ncbi:MAG: tetratricopeptide repeat protein [Taibaiella sp.]|nr:tetratricopeptide repeat protein [Taibaiella sp.]
MKKYIVLIFVFLPLVLHARKQGQQLIDSLLTELPKQREDTARVNILTRISFNYGDINPVECLKYARQDSALAMKLGWKRGIFKAHDALGTYYGSQTNYTEAVRCFLIALRAAEEIDYKPGIASACNDLGANYFYQGDFSTALSYFLKTVKVQEELGDESYIASATENLGNVYVRMGDYPKALDCFFSALRIVERLGDSERLANTSANIGLAYYYQNDFSNALQYDLKSLSIRELLGDKRSLAAVNGNIGLVYYKQGNYSKALEHEFKAVKADIEIGYKYDEAIFTGYIGEIFTKQGRHQQAINYTSHAHKLAEEIGDKHELALALTQTGRAYLQLVVDTIRTKETGKAVGELALDVHVPEIRVPSGRQARLNLAISFLSRGLDQAIKIDAPQIMQDCYQNLAAAYKLSGDYRRAMEHFELYTALRDSVYSTTNNKKIVQLEMRYVFDKKEDSLRRLQEQKDIISRAEISKQKSEKRFLLVGGVLMLILAGGSLYFLAFTRKAKKEIELQKNRAEQSERFKQQFLANMSHEIRTPMNAVLGMTTLTLDTSLSEKQRNYMTAVKKSAESLLVIINDILDLSKLEAGKLELEHIPFRLSEQLKQVVDTMQFKVEEKGLRLSTEVAADVPDILIGDPSRLNQVLINLVGNAIKFTEKGSVRVVVEKLPGADAALCFRVIDQGIGIPTDKLGKLFQSFSQADASTSRKYGGTGLGLSISKTLVELQGGKMDVKSVEGEGSEFSFVIVYGVADESMLPQQGGGTNATVASLDGIRLLVAEDNEYNQIVIRDTINSLIRNVHIDIADNGRMAVQLLEANDYDVVLMDIQMPELNGLDATAHIRKKLPETKRNVPVIALTASVLNTDLDKCTKAGMNAYVPKPFKREELLNALAKFYRNEHGEAPGQAVESSPTVATVDSSTRITNLSFLEEFCGGNREQMQKYVDIYLKVTPGNLEKIGVAAAKEDYTTLARVVHAMKAHLNYMGMSEARKIADEIESLATTGNDLDRVPQLIDDLENHCLLSRDELSVI